MAGLLQVRLYDLTGKAMMTDRIQVQTGTLLTYGVSDLSPGMYILEATGATRRATLRVTVH